MAKEYKTLTFEDNKKGRMEMGLEVDRLASQGWEIKSKELSQQGWAFGKTCCLGALFLPLALLGKKANVIQVILERNVDAKKTVTFKTRKNALPAIQIFHKTFLNVLIAEMIFPLGIKGAFS